MKRVTRLVVAAFLLLAILLAVRLCWTAALTETGWESIQSHWRRGTLGWFFDPPTRLVDRAPHSQAEYWLPEVDRVLARHPGDAQVMMGAARLLNEPFFTLRGNYLDLFEIPNGDGSKGFHFDSEALERSNSGFQNLCRQRCLDLAARAVALEPANVEWRREQAMLAIGYGDDIQPRDPDWEAVLAASGQVDSQNALYDYLAAHILLDASCQTSGYPDYLLTIQDQDSFERGLARLAQGRTKEVLAFAETSLPATCRFLERTRLPRLQQEQVLNGRSPTPGSSALLLGLGQWLGHIARHREATDPQAALGLHQGRREMLAQYLRTGVLARSDIFVASVKSTARYSLFDFALRHKDLFSAAELRTLEQDREDAMYEERVDRELGERFGRYTYRRDLCGPAVAGYSLLPEEIPLLSLVTVQSAPGVVVCLLLLATAGAVGFRLSNRTDLPRVRKRRHLLTVITAVVVTLIALGVAPLLDFEPVQPWIYTVLLLAIPLLIAISLGWHWLRGRRLRFGLRGMLLFTLGCCLLAGWAGRQELSPAMFAQLPFNFPIVPRAMWPEWTEASDHDFIFDVGLACGELTLVVLEWTVFRGPCWVIAIWAAWIAWSLDWKACERQRTEGASWPWREQAAAILRPFFRPALGMAMLALLLYLALAPIALQGVERDYQAMILLERQPQHYLRITDIVMADLQSDTEKLQELRALAQEQIAEYDQQKEKRQQQEEREKLDEPPAPDREP